MGEVTAVVPVVFAVLGILAAVFAVFLITRLQVRRKNPEEIDLGSVSTAMVEKHGWSGARAEAAKNEYLRSLTLLQRRPGFILAPWLDEQGRDDLDQFWHQHILETAKYASDCQSLFGRMIHHNPHVERGSEIEIEAVHKTRRLYARTFRTGYFGSKAEPGDFSGCSSCAAIAVDTASDSHHSGGDHGGNDGHDAGHSCGGHSCGGHGCGGH